MEGQVITEGATNNKIDAFNHDWSKALTELCSKLEGSTDECMVLYLNKGVNQKSYLHGLGTQKGIDFLNLHADIAQRFISFCYSSPVQSPDDDPVTGSPAQAPKDDLVTGSPVQVLEDDPVTDDDLIIILDAPVQTPEDDPLTGMKRKILDETPENIKKRKQDEDDNDVDDNTEEECNSDLESFEDEDECPQNTQETGKEPGSKITSKGEQEFKCSECEFTASCPLSLKFHELEAHTGVENVQRDALEACSQNRTNKEKYTHKDCNFVSEHHITLGENVQDNHSEIQDESLTVSPWSPSSEIETNNRSQEVDSVRGKRKSAILSKQRISEIMEFEENQKIFSCKICNQVFAERTTVMKHLQESHPGKDAKDSIIFHQVSKELSIEAECDKEMKRRCKNKKQTKSSLSKYKCTTCRLSFYSQLMLNHHQRVVHQPMRCSRRFTDRYLELKNLKKASLEENCSSEFKESITLKNLREMTLMMDIELEKGMKPKTCQECNAHFTTFNSWLKHIKAKNHDDITEEMTNICCFTCCKFFTCVSGLQNHMRITKHTGNIVKLEKKIVGVTTPAQSNESFLVEKKETLFRCTLCLKEYVKRENCEKHIKGNVCLNKWRKCPICFYVFRTKNLYWAHSCLKDKSLQDKGFPICNRGGKTENPDDEFFIAEEVEVVQDSLKQKKCLECSKEFPNFELFKSHMIASGHEQVSEEETIYLCYTCNKYYTSEESLRSHMKHTNHTGNKEKERKYTTFRKGAGNILTFKCVRCHREYNELQSVRNHLNRALCFTTRRFQCGMCRMYFRNINLYRMHMRRGQHVRRDPIFRDVKPMADLEPSVEEETIYKCYTCSKYYANIESLKRHMMAAKHSGDPDKDNQRELVTFKSSAGEVKHRCSLCNLDFSDKRNCQDHIALAQCMKKTKKRCTFCKKQMTCGINIYYVHMLENHSDQYPYKCELCSQTFLLKEAYKRHEAAHQEGNTSQKTVWTCDICGYVCKKQQSKQYHIRNVCPRRKSFNCERCGFHSTLPSKWQLHNVKHHPEEFPFVCDECGRMFKERRKFNQHKSNHALERGSVQEAAKFCRIFMCADCGRWFSDKDLYVSHCLRHFNEKITCPICAAKVKRRVEMRRHLQRCHLLTKREEEDIMKDMPKDEDLLQAVKNREQNRIQQNAQEEVCEETTKVTNQTADSFRKQNRGRAVRQCRKKTQS